MKFKYLLTSLLAGLGLIAVGCSESDDIKVLDEIQVSSSYVSIDMAGGSSTITVTAKDAWSVDTKSVPDWLTITPASGSAGETTVTFTAPATLTGKGTVDVKFICSGKTQNVNVIQGLKKAEPSTCAQIIAGADGKSYRATGTCTKIVNTLYGNWYLNDGTGELYIYGTLDNTGAAQKFANVGLAEGDIATVEGVKSTYGGVTELVDVMVVSIVKSLVKVDSDPAALEKADSTFTIDLTCKGAGLSVVIPDDAKAWLHVSSIVTSGTTAKVTFNADANTALAPRQTTVSFSSTSGSKTSTVSYAISQKGNLPEPVGIGTIDPTKTTYACVVGKVTAISKQAYILSDASGSVQVYYGNTFTPANYSVGKIRTVAGKISVYNFGMEMSGIDYDVLSTGKITPAAITIVDGAALDAMVAATVGKDKVVDAACPVKYIQVTGTLTVSGSHYNLAIPGAATAIGSLSNPLDSFGLANMNGASVTIEGYTTSISGGKYVNIIVNKATKN